MLVCFTKLLYAFLSVKSPEDAAGLAFDPWFTVALVGFVALLGIGICLTLLTVKWRRGERHQSNNP